MAGIITILTDFGTTDPYVGIMKGVILSLNPEARIVDLTHEIPHGDIRAGAFALSSAATWFPPGTVHLAVVDPGVGGRRKAVAVEGERYVFVGPDNGLLAPAAGKDRVKRVVEISNPKYALDRISSTFHGRDVFAPAAAHLAGGLDPDSLGPVLDGLAGLEVPEPARSPGRVAGEVVHVDGFGNLITNITEEDLPAGPGECEVAVKGMVIEGISSTYSDAAEGEVLALMESTGRLEVARCMGSAARALGAGAGEAVTVRRRGEE